MAKGKVIRVYPDRGDWVVKKDGASRASKVFGTKKEALDEANKIADNQGLTIVIHAKTGRIQRRQNPSTREEEDCFLTTACVWHYGLSDDCRELQTLRNFRDQYLSTSEYGASLIEEYYDVAPMLVIKLESRPDREQLYHSLFEQILKSCNEIEHGNYAQATSTYIEAVGWLKRTLE